jgi:predicted unusual protein kinase regulating ubiquinone biosynthesis (AarF/ABC1/UbiB family)
MSTEHLPPYLRDQTYHLNRRRYLRIIWFFSRVALQAIVLYIVLQPIVGRGIIKRGEEARFQRWARQFRELAVQLGGVMIKLGQFVSSRVDILPPEITRELAGLQDEVPATSFDRMTRTLREDLGADWETRFSHIAHETVASASFGQAYRARLAGSEDKVVIKVQRPGIAQIVFTDLSALEVVSRLAMRFKFISRRANVPLLLDEFARVLWEELDYTKEASNAERFAALFAEDFGVYIPAVYNEHSTPRVIVLEDVTAIKLDDYAAIEAAGIDRGAVAQRLLDTYLTMVFIYRFFHADPHPGNIFVYPLPENDTHRRTSRPFYLIFIDFGMTGEISPQLAAGLREALIALITRDSKRLVRSYQQLDVLLPGADLNRLEEANEAAFDRVYGLSITEIASMDMDIMRDFTREFGDLLLSLPFQVPQDFVYLGRAVGILSGMCTGLDPAFDPWSQIQPFVQQFMLGQDGGESGTQRWTELIDWQTLRALVSPETVNLALTTGQDLLTRVAGLPVKADNALTKLERGDLRLAFGPDDDLSSQLNRLERTGGQVVTALVFGSVALSSTLLYINGETGLGTGGFGLAALILIVMLFRGR